MTILSKFVLILGVCNFPGHNPYSVYIKLLVLDNEYVQSLLYVSSLQFSGSYVFSLEWHVIFWLLALLCALEIISMSLLLIS